MSAERNKALVRRFLEAHAMGDLDTVDEMLAIDFVVHRIVAKLQTQVNSDFVLYSPRAASTGCNWRGACRSSRLAARRHRTSKPSTQVHIHTASQDV